MSITISTAGYILIGFIAIPFVVLAWLIAWTVFERTELYETLKEKIKKRSRENQTNNQ